MICNLSSAASSLQPESELPEPDLCRALDTDGAELFLLLPRTEFECYLRLLPPGANCVESRLSTPTTEPITIGLFLEESQIHNWRNAWPITVPRRTVLLRRNVVQLTFLCDLGNVR
jgi:hypothetical protein